MGLKSEQSLFVITCLLPIIICYDYITTSIFESKQIRNFHSSFVSIILRLDFNESKNKKLTRINVPMDETGKKNIQPFFFVFVIEE